MLPLVLKLMKNIINLQGFLSSTKSEFKCRLVDMFPFMLDFTLPGICKGIVGECITFGKVERDKECQAMTWCLRVALRLS